jgi:hypothetical protein
LRLRFLVPLKKPVLSLALRDAGVVGGCEVENFREKEEEFLALHSTVSALSCKEKAETSVKKRMPFINPP